MTWTLLVIALVAGAAIAWLLTVRRADRTQHWPEPEPYEGEVPPLRLSRFGDAGDVPVGDVVPGAVEVGTGAYPKREAADEQRPDEPDGLAWDDGTADAADLLDEGDGEGQGEGEGDELEPDASAFGGQATTPPTSLPLTGSGSDEAARRWMPDAPDEDSLLARDEVSDRSGDDGDEPRSGSPAAQS
jgi:hypothetical protein